MTDETLARLLEKQAIHELVLTYCRAVDRLDLTTVRAVYAPEGRDHHTGFDGTADEYVAWLGEVLPHLDGTMHLVGNHLAEVRGDTAIAETYGVAVHWGTPADDERLNFTSGFRYVDRLVRLDGGWAIAERFAVREWTHSDVGRSIAREGDGPRGRRDGQDPWVALRRRWAGQDTTASL